MDLHLTSEQILLRDSAAKFSAAAGPKVARGLRQRDPGFAPERLRQAGELGWLGILVPPAADGLGLGLTELALVLEQAGRGLVCEPIGLAAISAAALAQGHAPHPMLKKAMTGSALVVPALQENAHGDDLLEPRTRAAQADGSLRLTGTKTFVCADGADGFLVSAGGRDGTSLYYVARHAPGSSLTTTQTVDGRKLATLELKDAPADLIPSRQSSRSAVEALTDLALIALSAELLGVMEKAQEITFDYLRVRKQFGKPIGSFQALQHQAVNIYIRTETTRSLLYQVAANDDPYRIDPALAAAVKAKASEDAMVVVETCIQLHGAIGFTDEHDIGLYLKRALLLSSLFGNAAAQRRRYAKIADLTA
ncbi:MAG TPA: acyl-CoA dehydrogenase family protein [Xanthobacteraceae bacterium]|jgi:alkylation response protein AidB-like acyl-CoA dehydrogenase|nr:acyl-CoA dehydrogenase family protein [Xanthobacteraceae bacterium]